MVEQLLCIKKALDLILILSIAKQPKNKQTKVIEYWYER